MRRFGLFAIAALVAGGLALSGCPDWFKEKKEKASDSARDSLWKAGKKFADEAKRATDEEGGGDR